ncbi:hypothetical protein [Aliiglaciecola lipolytica]|uniref:Uncharacterized protein n=1 Tax=Aliiglaciecola lipolytica E3 TaxID=1127673 RepID=K6XNC9_9ALTE|nr:hypothetical protein [Aliiglaciecola lipolytica]GAC13196.1 hypothetical protein GLIP_0550 [Aliiglaciecola lipolytica E3]
MKVSPTHQQAMREACSGFFDELGNRIEWKWDEHFGCLLSEFSVDHAQQVYLIAQKHFPHTWNKKQFKKADPILRHRAGFFNILEKNQELLTKDDSGEFEMMLSWWPWGHGATISVRLFRANSQPFQAPRGILHRISGAFAR